MKNKIKKYTKELVYFFIILLIVTNIASWYRAQNLNATSLDITSIKLLDNYDYKIDKTKPILIYFWATWCPICKVQSPNIERLSKNFQVLSVAVDSKETDIKEYLKEHNLSFSVVNDKDYTLAKRFKIAVFPTTMIYDKNQNLLYSDVGYTSTLGLWLRMLLA